VRQGGALRCDLRLPFRDVHAIQKRRVGDRENQTHKPLQNNEKGSTVMQCNKNNTSLFGLSVKIVARSQLMTVSSDQ
jgi:hypothetical protein